MLRLLLLRELAPRSYRFLLWVIVLVVLYVAQARFL